MGHITLLRHPKVQGKAALNGKTDVCCCPQALAATVEKIINDGQDEQSDELIISSPLQRCLTLAQQINKSKQLPLIIEPRLQEMDFGKVDGIPFDEQRQNWPLLESFWSTLDQHQLPEAESLQHFNQRVIQAWQAILAEHGDKNLLIITHGGVIRQIIAHCLQLPYQQAALYQHLKIDYASKTQFNYDAQYKLLQLTHLGG